MSQLQFCPKYKHAKSQNIRVPASQIQSCPYCMHVKLQNMSKANILRWKHAKGKHFNCTLTKMQTFSPSIPADMWNAHKPAPMLCPSVLRHAMLRYVPLGWGCWLHSYTAIASLASPILPPLLLSCCPLSTCVAGHSWSQCHSYKALWSSKDTLISIAQNSLVPCIVYTDQCCQKHLHSLLLKSPNKSI